MQEFIVKFWGSHPDQDNDDCFYGVEYESLAEAVLTYNEPADKDIEYIEITGPGVYGIRKNLNYSRRKIEIAFDFEYAMQAGMLGGIESYNDALNY